MGGGCDVVEVVGIKSCKCGEDIDGQFYRGVALALGGGFLRYVTLQAQGLQPQYRSRVDGESDDSNVTRE